MFLKKKINIESEKKVSHELKGSDVRIPSIDLALNELDEISDLEKKKKDVLSTYWGHVTSEQDQKSKKKTEVVRSCGCFG